MPPHAVAAVSGLARPGGGTGWLVHRDIKPENVLISTTAT